MRQPPTDPLVAFVAREAERVLRQRRTDALAANFGQQPDAQDDRVGLLRVEVERGKSNRLPADERQEASAVAALARDPRPHLVH